MRRGAAAFIGIAAAAAAACSGPNLSTTEQAAVVVSPSAVSFPGSVEVGATEVIAKAIRFSPASGSMPSFDQITAIVESCADFTVTGPVPGDIRRTCAGQTNPVEPTEQNVHGGFEENAIVCTGATITVAEYDVSFHPVTKGAKSCVVTFQGNFGQQSVTLSGMAVPPPFAARVSPTTINFGDVRRNFVSAGVTLSIQNTGSMQFPIDSITPPGSVFEITLGGGTASLDAHMVPVDGLETYTIRCRPTDIVPYVGMVIINSPQMPKFEVLLECAGTDSQLIGPTDLVDLRARQHLLIDEKIRITNVGNENATITDYSVVGIPELTLLQPGARGTLVPGGFTEATVRYTAEAERVHMSLGSLIVRHDSNKSTTIPISGEALATEVGVAPAAIDFGPICVMRTATRPVQLFANLAGYVNVLQEPALAGALSIEADGDPMFPFLLAGDHGPPLPLTARFQPDTANEPVMATVNVSTDAPMMRTTQISMTGEGMPPGITASPARVDFGALDFGGSIAPGQPVLLSNCTANPLAITDVRIEGPNAIDFGIAFPANPRVTIDPYERVEFLVVMTPGKVGEKQAQIVFYYGDGLSTSANLVGITTTDDRRESYYDCSAGGGGAAPWPLGLALIAVLRRRRGRRRAAG